MTTLASVADYEVVTGVTVGEDSTRIERLLELASGAVLDEAHGQLIVAGESTETVRPYEGVGRLSQRPVTDVTSVVVEGVTLTEGDDYRWTPGGDRRPAYLIRVVNGRDAAWWDCELTVVYEHGWTEVPSRIVVAVINMAKGVYDLAGGGEVASKTSGPFSVSFVEGTQTADMRVAGPVKSLLDQLCGIPGPTSVPVLGTIETRQRMTVQDRFCQ